MAWNPEGLEVAEARRDVWRACCGQKNPTKHCQNPELHIAIRDLDTKLMKLLTERTEEFKLKLRAAKATK